MGSERTLTLGGLRAVMANPIRPSKRRTETMITDRDAKLYEIVSAVLELPDGTDVSRVRQLSMEGWDSLAHVSLMLAIESEFGVVIDIGDQIALTSVPAIRLYLEERGL